MSGETETRIDPAQGADQPRAARPPLAAWVGAWAALLALPLWMSQLFAPWLLLAGAGALLWTWPAVRLRDRWALATVLALWLGIGVAAGVQRRLGEISRDWPRVEAELDESGARALNTALDDLVERGERAVDGIAAAVPAQGGIRSIPQIFGRLEGLRHLTGVSALALFDSGGVPMGWAGEHRGTVPAAVRRGGRSYVFSEGPLFDYLYFVRPLPQGRTAVAAVLLEADLAVGEGEAPFAERFAERRGLMPRFTLPERARGESVWDWSTDRPILSVSFEALTQQRWWERVVSRGLRGVGLAWLVTFVLLGIAWYRRGPGAPGPPLAVATLGLLVIPIGGMVGMEDLFSPLRFVLSIPGPWDVTLGLLLILLTGITVWVLTREAGRMPRRRIPRVVQLLLPALLFPLAIRTIDRSAGAGWLASHPGGGFSLQLAATLLLGIPVYLLFRWGGERPRPGARLPLLVLGGLSALALALGVAVVMFWHPNRELSPWLPAAWALPVGAVALSLPRLPAPRASLRAWLLAGWMAASAALPYLWTMHVGAELGNAERELAELGTEPNPFLDFLLGQFAEQALSFARDGEEGVNLLYHGWIASGLAREGYEARLTIWRGGEAETELRLTEMAAMPEMVRAMADSASRRTEPFVQLYHEVEGLHYLLLVPLPGGRVISVAVPPRQRIGRATALARFLHPESVEDAASTNESLYLVPSPDGASRPYVPEAEPEPVQWVRIDNGWRSEAQAHFPGGWMHVHLLLRTDTFPMLSVRVLLALSAILLVFLALWLLARVLCGELTVLPFLRRQWLRSFRGRLTVALFFFFLLPTTFFGAVAYGAVSREVTLSAANLARRTLEQAVPEVSAGRSLGVVGPQVGSDLLLYRQGTLEGAAAPEVLDLGIFHTWLPPEVYLTFSSGEDLEEREERRLGENEYLVAYRRVDPARVLAAPIPLASHEISRRQRDFANVALLVSLLGGALSVVLSLLVGRALTRPLDELGEAVATVGAGNLRVRLPEGRPDEFGSVYGAFNRMVRRLHRARTALVRETRRTETIVAEAATGVLALDAAGAVELVNPRASEILRADLTVGEPLPRRGPLLEALSDAVAEFWRSGAGEAGMELEIGGRIVRLRLRRLLEAQEPRGAVVALEDVTSEVSTARVLAWGEMARQVAHEIKNPLTPIKLSVQHLRRAFADGRPDFGEILDRNVDAILREIDRLGEIARAFSRFGSPQQDVEELERVDVARAVEETLALYRGGGGGIRYEVELNGGASMLATARMGELKEVLVNLLENAREALDGSGEIRVSAEPSPDGRRVEVRVEDSGEGIPAELLARVFEPHFSTRTSGTGLGLAIVRRLVESWGGTITAESEPGVGTRMRISLRAGGAR